MGEKAVDEGGIIGKRGTDMAEPSEVGWGGNMLINMPGNGPVGITPESPEGAGQTIPGGWVRPGGRGKAWGSFENTKPGLPKFGTGKACIGCVILGTSEACALGAEDAVEGREGAGLTRAGVEYPLLLWWPPFWLGFSSIVQ